MAIAIFACMFGVIWGYKYASASNGKTSNSPANIDKLGEELSRARGEYKDYRDTVDSEFTDINTSISRLNAAYAALLNNFVNGAEKLCPDNKDALALATNDRDLIAIGHDSTSADETEEEIRQTA
jgi:uncharacterized membrane-anchored protein YhcB (DUF1043 family)